MIHVPTTVEELKPPAPADIYTEAANFLRAHLDDMVPFHQALSGEAPSIHGSFNLDEAAMLFKVKELAGADGYTLLTSVSTYRLRKAMRVGYKRDTDISVRMLEAQRKQIEKQHRHELSAKRVETSN
jgi:hypothetical protein